MFTFIFIFCYLLCWTFDVLSVHWLTWEPVEDRTLLGLSLRRDVHCKLHCALTLRTANKYTEVTFLTNDRNKIPWKRLKRNVGIKILCLYMCFCWFILIYKWYGSTLSIKISCAGTFIPIFCTFLQPSCKKGYVPFFVHYNCHVRTFV